MLGLVSCSPLFLSLSFISILDCSHSTSQFLIYSLTSFFPGRSLALKFGANYPVVLLARNPSNYENIVKEINSAGGLALGISADVSSPESMKAAFEEISKSEVSKGRKLAAAVFNVGGSFVRKPFLEMSLAEYEGGWAANG